MARPKPTIKTVPIEPTAEQIEQAWWLLLHVKIEDLDHAKRIAAAVYRTMVDFAPARPPSGLTRAQGVMWRAIARFEDKNACAPSVGELAKMTGRDVHSADSILDALQRRGFINRTPGVPRSIALTVRPNAGSHGHATS